MLSLEMDSVVNGSHFQSFFDCSKHFSVPSHSLKPAQRPPPTALYAKLFVFLTKSSVSETACVVVAGLAPEIPQSPYWPE